jgi:predicted transposase YbfD/YdcC
MKIKELKSKLSEVRDPRRQYGNLLHKLWEILVIALLSVICLGEDYDDMEEFGKEREEWLKNELGLELLNGIPDGDTFRRVLERIKPSELRQKLNESIVYVRQLRDIVPIDGKTKKQSGCKSKKRNAAHIISAFACENRLVLGEVKSEAKYSESQAVPELLDSIDIWGSIVTADAGNCQKAIAAKIIDEDADYVLTLKGNQKTLHAAVENYFLYNPASADCAVKYIEEVNGSRLEKREYWLESGIKWLPMRGEWTGLQSVGMVKSVVIRNGKPSFEIRFFITSLTDIGEFAYAVRKHWSIENQLHWCLDVIWREDKAKAGKGNAAMNINILEKHALHLIDKADLSAFIKMGKPSKKRKRFKATLNPEVLIAVILSGE